MDLDTVSQHEEDNLNDTMSKVQKAGIHQNSKRHMVSLLVHGK